METFQLRERLARQIRENYIQLRNLSPIYFPNICNGKRAFDIQINNFTREIVIAERGVGKTMTERESRSYVMGRIPTIVYE